MSSFWTFDPGMQTLAWAFFSEGRLVDCGLSRTKEKNICAQIVAHKQNLLGAPPAGDRAISERMAWRGKNAKTRNAQVLMDLNLIAGHFANEWLLPSEWKGMVPKEVHQPRILAALAPEERALVDVVKPASLRHNVIDAVGIGLFVAGRMKPCLATPDFSSLPKLPTKRTMKAKRPSRSKVSLRSSKTTGTASRKRLTKRRGIKMPPARGPQPLCDSLPGSF